MKATPKQYAQVLYESLENKSKQEVVTILNNFTKVLIDNNQVSQLEKILSYFNNLWNRENNILEAQIISAHELDKKDLGHIQEFVNKKANGKQVVFKNSIDKNIRGGFVVRLGDEIFDSSLEKRIRNLKKTMLG